MKTTKPTAQNPVTRFQVAEFGALLAEPARAGMLLALMDGTVRPAGELARTVGIAPSTASSHLQKLIQGGLLKVVNQGRHRYFMLADEHIAHMLETLTVGPDPQHKIPHANRDRSIAAARTCYDHLAGRLGVGLFQAMRESDIIALAEDAVRVSPTGVERLRELALLDTEQPAPDLPGRTCVDWTERRFHLGGPLGAWFTTRAFDKNWLRRRATTRAIVPTELGRARLRELGVPTDALP